jgi:methylated-DNA-[protein]-cysteine S-methyltransferase
MMQLYPYLTPHQSIAVRQTTHGMLWSLDFASPPANTPALPSGVLSDWLDAYFNHAPLSVMPALRPPRHALDAAMRSFLLAIPAGETRTYGELATAIGTSPRAAGSILGANPVAVIIPCHRIVARNGLGGFHGGEVWKRFLLQHEQA